jgi:hypothetical protein
MSGMPMESLKQGAVMVAEQVLDKEIPLFEQLNTLPFNHDTEVHTSRGRLDLKFIKNTI